MTEKPEKKQMSLFTLVLITLIAVDSLRSITISAQYGFSLVFYYLLAALVFLIPSALVSAELSSSLPRNGGLYIWIREAFGDNWASFVMWLQWLYNICWYPTILALLAIALIYPYAPSLAHNKTYILLAVLALYWLATYINMQGIEASAKLSRFTAIFGTLLPIILVTSLSLYWLKLGHQSMIQFNFENFVPDLTKKDNLLFISNILYSLIGIEITAYHAQDVKNPAKNFPLALLLSTILILATIICASLAVAMVIPEEMIKQSLISGLLDAFYIFFTELDMLFLFPIVCILIALGTLGSVGIWLIGPSKGLLIAAEDGHLPALLAKKNKKGAPQNILIAQGIIFSLLSCTYILMPSVNTAYSILSILTAQLALFGYVFMFFAVIKLRKSHPDLVRPFKIPAGKFGLYLTCGLGVIATLITIILSFAPQNDMGQDHYFHYELMMFSIFVIILFVIHKISIKHRSFKS